MTATDLIAFEPAPPEPRPAMTGPGHDRTPVQRAFRLILLGCLAVGVVFLAVLLAYVLTEGWQRLDTELWRNQASQIHPATAGAQAAIVGTLWLMVGTALIILPVGVLAAVYLEEYADRDKWYNRLIELNIQNLAAVPSVVYGILGLGLIVRGPLSLGPVVLAGALILALLVLPVVIISSREAIRAVPDSLRDGSLALGATRWQTVWRTVLPNSIPGIATGSILALSRAIGEAAPLVVIGVAAFVQFNPASVFDRFTALPIQIYNYASRPQEDFIILSSALIVVLLAILLLMNSAAVFIRNKYQRRW
ncbi:MAG: phosphate ABC transporter permease PstA [Jiangellaceae bacterium]|nr:phosphate ABC transporter permease PstA [Jiangellaceae bacterium]